jgi:hypothetical protein
MPRRSKALLDRADRLHDASVRPVVLIIGCPEATRLFPTRMRSEREAVIGTEHFEALDGETTKTFHARMCQTARDRGVRIVSIGSDEPQLESRYNLDGTLKAPPPIEGQAEPPGDATRH